MMFQRKKSTYFLEVKVFHRLHREAFTTISFFFLVYRTDEGKTCLLPVVSKVEKQLANDVTLDNGYGPVLGHEPFIKAAVRLLLGTDSPSVNQGRAFGMQCVSGCGALRVAAEFLAHISNFTVVYSSNPTWGKVTILN